jgi:hypothetical protein
MCQTLCADFIGGVLGIVYRKAANSMQTVYALLLVPLVLLSAIEAMVLVYFGAKFNIVTRAPEMPPDADASEKELAQLKKDANRRVWFMILCLFLTTMSSVGIGFAMLGTDYKRAPSSVAQHDLIKVLLFAALRTLVSFLIVGALLFSSNPSDNKLWCAACILGPLTVLLSVFSSLMFFNAVREVELSDQKPPFFDEEAPLLDSSMTDRTDDEGVRRVTRSVNDEPADTTPASFTFIFNLPESSTSTKSSGQKVDGTGILKAIYASGESSSKNFSHLEAVCRDKRPDVELVRRALFDDLYDWFRAEGFDVQLYSSTQYRAGDDDVSKKYTAWQRLLRYLFEQASSQVDVEKMFLRVSIASSQGIRSFIAKQGVELQTNYHLLESLGIKQPPETSMPYVPYDNLHVEALQKELGADEAAIFRSSPYGGVFRTVDQLRIMRHIIDQRLNLESCKDKQLILGFFASHSKQALADFQINCAALLDSSTWGSILFNPYAGQPSKAVRDYFGEATAFYFEWIGFTCRALVPLAVFGVLMAFSQIGSADTQYRTETYKVIRNLFDVGWAAFVVVWGTLYMVEWRRHQYKLRLDWNTMNDEGDRILRPSTQGVMVPNPLNENEKILQYPRRRVHFGTVLVPVISSLFFLLVWACVGGIYSLRPSMDKLVVEILGPFAELNKHYELIKGETIITWIFSLFIAIVNSLWEWIARLLTRIENQRTVYEYANSLRVKLFAMQLYNTYSPLFYLALIQRNWGQEREEHWWGVKMIDTCPDHDCFNALQTGLYGTLGGLLIPQVAQLIAPYLQLKFFAWLQQEALEAKYGPMVQDSGVVGNVLTHIGLSNRPAETATMSAQQLTMLSFMEEQGLMQDYDIDKQISDYQSLILTASYVLIFSGITPLLGIIALPVFLLRLRVDAWRMCVLLQRPFPYLEDGIGPWNHLIDFLMWIGLACSVAIPLLNMPRFDHLKPVEKVLLFVIVERLLIVLKLVCVSLFPEKSDAVQLIINRRQYVLDKLRAARYMGLSKMPQLSIQGEIQDRSATSESIPVKLDQHFVDRDRQVRSARRLPVDEHI